MLPQNLKVNSPIVLTTLVSAHTLAILIDKEDHALIRILDSSTQTPLKTYKKVFSKAEGSHYRVVENHIASYDVVKKELEVMELSSAKVFCNSTLRYHRDEMVTSLYLSGDGSLCITGDAKGKINLWDPKKPEPEYSFSEYSSAVVTTILDGSHTTLISGRADGSLILYRLDKAQEPILLAKHEKEIKRVFFINETVMSVDLGGMLNICDIESSKIVRSIKLEAGIRDVTLAYESRFAIVYTNDNKISMINLEKIDEKALHIDNITLDINSMVFDDASKRLILSVRSGSLLFYDFEKEPSVLAYTKKSSQQSVQAAKKEQSTPEETPKKHFTFLSVDDSKSIRNVIVKAIKIGFPGTEVLEAQDGAEALNMLHEHDIDCVILDWNMPKLNGEEVLKYIRAFKKFDKIKIIMATTEAERIKVLNAIKNGADGYIVKPFNSETFFTKVAKSIMPENETNSMSIE